VEIRRPESDEEIEPCFPLLRQLRPDLTAEALVEFVRSHRDAGYRLVALIEADQVVGVAGYRVLESLGHGRLLFLDDMVTDASARSRGHGKALLDWIEQEAAALGCSTVELDSGVQREGAHRFYERHGYTLASHHYAKEVEAAARHEKESTR
jgi:GNAT superfamily N-acetyltransferase